VDEDFDIASFDEAYSPDDFSTDDMNFATAVGQQTGGFGDDNTAQVIANQLAQPQVGLNRSNITNLVSIDPATGQKTDLYDPTFAAAFDISRGLDPTNNMGGTGGLAVPSYLRPQIESGRVDARGEPIRYFSEGERVIQEDFTDFIRSSQQAAAGIPNLLSSGLGAIKSVFDGLSFLKDSKAGTTVEETVDAFGNVVDPNVTDPLSATGAVDAFGTPVSRAEQTRERNLGFGLGSMMVDPSFTPRPKETVTKTALDSLVGDVDKTTAMDAGASLAMNPNLSPDFVSRMRAIDALPPYKSRGIVSLPQAGNLQNQQIAAGEKTGQSLVDAPQPPPRKSDVFPMSAGFILSQLSSDPTPTVNPRDNPRDPNNPGGTMLTFPDPIKDLSLKAPPGFVDIVMREGKSPTFAGTDISIFGGRDPSAKLYSPLTEAEAQAQIDTGFSLEPILGALDVSKDPRDYTSSGFRTGVNLTPTDFRVEQRDPENVIRVPISSLPASAQEVASLRSGELDYGTSFPLQTILDARREKAFTQKELGDLLAGFKR
tara:strand:- start:1873 stop:3495 length:1623 start_codon:yes stop_codon:yes gene_type:complete